MDNAAKLEAIREWIDPQERVTVDFLDEKGLTAVITECTNEYVVLSAPVSSLTTAPVRADEAGRGGCGPDPLHERPRETPPLQPIAVDDSSETAAVDLETETHHGDGAIPGGSSSSWRGCSFWGNDRLGTEFKTTNWEVQ